jgi:hypothetical protein
MVKQITFSGIHAWNIEANVGLSSPNKTLDVQLVQFGYLMMSINPKNVLQDFEREALAGMKVGQPCNGTPSDPLVKVIIAHQRSRGGVQDGKVSVISTASGAYVQGGKFTYILAALCNNMRQMAIVTYPRIDQHELCPFELKKAVFESYGNPGFLIQ